MLVQMAARKSSSDTHGKTDDQVFIEEFAREFFGTNQTYDESSQIEKTKVKRKKYKKEKETYEDTYIPNVKKDKRKVKTQRNETEINNGHPRHTPVYPSDSRKALVKRFLELKVEFLSLSDRLHDAHMPNVSKQLTQLLTERQNLVKLLLDMDASAPSNFDLKNEDGRLQDQSKPRHASSMPRKAKSVHWSDEHLGGSIIQDSSAYVRQNPDSNGVQETPSWNNEDISESPPRYKMVDIHHETNHSHKSRSDSQLDLKHCFYKTRIHDKMEYIKEILNEAAELRRQACCMIWRAHYLEQLCDVDGVVKHVYRTPSNLPTLPRYSHLYR